MDKFKYLQSNIRKDCEVDNNRIQTRLVKWSKATRVICNRKVHAMVR